MYAAGSPLAPGLRTARWGARRGFTLIELLVVISIITLLLALMLPSLATARDEAARVKCAANLQQFGVAIAMCLGDHNGFFPMWDDGERSTVHDRIIATWIDVLKQRHYFGMDGGYCPVDLRPDFLNAQRGIAWDFKYPPPQTNQGETGGCDYSYGISVPLASGAHKSDDAYTYHGITEKTRILLQRNVSRRILAGDGFWDWIHNMSGFGLKFNQFDAGNWYSNTAGYRHGLERTFRPAANFLKQDLHVEMGRYDLSDFLHGIDTSEHFITYPGEPLNVYPALGTDGGSPPGGGFPGEIDPYAITGPGANGENSQWISEIRIHKGWDI